MDMPLPYKPADYDLPFEEAGAYAQQLASLGVTTIFVEWTCPRCGERVQCEVVVNDDPTKKPNPNSVRAGKFVGFHTRYSHAERADGSTCGQIVGTLAWRFSIIGVAII